MLFVQLVKVYLIEFLRVEATLLSFLQIRMLTHAPTLFLPVVISCYLLGLVGETLEVSLMHFSL